MSTIWQNFRGHAELRVAFARAIDRGRLTQAYLFLGPEGVGKQLFARRLAQSLFCDQRPPGALEACGECSRCRPFLAGNHPDFLLVERDPGKRELTVAKFIGERDQRGKAGLCYELSIRPVGGSRKIAIINDADTMNDEAANALLKTLEEPPPGAMLILIAANPQNLLPTIHSRCQQVRFYPLPETEIAEVASSEGWVQSPEEAAQLAALSGGSLSLAQRLSQPGYRELRLQWIGALSTDRWDGMSTAKSLADSIEKLAGDAPSQRELAVWLLQSAVEFYRTALYYIVSESSSDRGLHESRRLAERLSADRDVAVDHLGECMSRCALAVQHLEQNVSLGLCLEALCGDLARHSVGV